MGNRQTSIDERFNINSKRFSGTPEPVSYSKPSTNCVQQWVHGNFLGTSSYMHGYAQCYRESTESEKEKERILLDQSRQTGAVYFAPSHIIESLRPPAGNGRWFYPPSAKFLAEVENSYTYDLLTHLYNLQNISEK